MARVLVSTSSFGRYDARPLERLAAAGYQVTVNPYGRRLAPEESSELLRSAVGLVAGTESLGRAVLESAAELRVISRCGAGLDGIDLDAAAELGIRVLRTTDAHVDAVAELTLAGTLNVLRLVGQADRDLRSGRWHKPMGRLLKGKTVGIVGLGRTGRRLVELLAPFSAEILAADPEQDAAFAAARGVTYGSLDTLVEESDILTLHLGYSPAAHHLIDAKRIRRMKSGAVLVNAARGGLVDERALAAALRSGRLAGAFLDTFEKEPYDGPLLALDNVLLTPHIGSYAVEGRIEMEIEAAENLIRALAEER